MIDILAEAIRLFHEGRFDLAEMFLRQARVASPDDPAVLHLLGLSICRAGRAAEGAELILQAIALAPGEARYHCDLGLVLKAQGKWRAAATSFRAVAACDPQAAQGWLHLAECRSELSQWADAVPAYRRAIVLEPGNAGVLCNLGIALHNLGRLDEAVRCQHQALAVHPAFPAALINLGCLLKDQGRASPAIAVFRRALSASPDYGRAHYNLACCLQGQRLLDEAAVHYRHALACEPQAVDARANLGSVLREQNKWDEAERCFRQALAIRPNHDEALCNLGGLLQDRGRLSEAEAVFRTGVAVSPRYARHHSNLGCVLHARGGLEEAIAAFHGALALEPDYVDAHFNLALAYLQKGDFAEGWSHYEWRWRKDGFEGGAPRHGAIPPWRGEAAAGRTILLWCEQGFGDSIQLVRYGADLSGLGWSVVLEAPSALYRLFSAIPGVTVIRQGAAVPPCDVQAPLFSLPGLLGRIPNRVPYLFARPEDWGRTLDGLDGLKVGVVWRGNPRHRRDHHRSIPVALFASCLPVRGVSAVVLQTDATTEELAAFHGPVFNAGPLLGDFAVTAALIDRLDLVIAVDTAVCHLAGALGRPTWTLIESVSDWRWMLDRPDSPWYPTMTLLRQPHCGDWAAVTTDVFQRLTDLAGLKRSEQSAQPG